MPRKRDDFMDYTKAPEDIHHVFKAEKAYRNLDFLNSAEARPIRVLAEFLEPGSRFRKNRVKDTIVFFGSARSKPMKDARWALEQAKDKAKAEKNSPESRTELDRALNGVKLAKYYEDATELSRRLTEWSMGLQGTGRRYLICSGGGPGMMEAANKGAELAGGKSIGLNISLPFEQYPNEFITPELNFEFHYFFIRKFWFVYLAQAMVIFPGGFGTFDEFFELLTLVQTQKTVKKMPIVVYGSEFWKRMIDFEALAEWGVISPEDLDLFEFADDVDTAFKYITRNLDQNNKGRKKG
jgi:uncharacterized protein (TIGR00730 family)